MSWSLFACGLPWHPYPWNIFIGAGLMTFLAPYLLVVDLVVYLLEPARAVPALVLFALGAWLMRRKSIRWWFIVLMLVPCSLLAAISLDALGWAPKPIGPL